MRLLLAFTVLVMIPAVERRVVHRSSRTPFADSPILASRHSKESFPDSEMSAFVVRMLLTTQQSPLGRSMSREHDGD
jgi:hypothetical protein